MGISIRRASMYDILQIQKCNLTCLPENYQFRYYLYLCMTWPELLYVAEITIKKKIVGYVLAKMEHEENLLESHGHITSISVLRSYRKLGLATKLMKQSQKAIIEIYKANFISLHVRESNLAAKHLYTHTLKFRWQDTEKNYYADGENAFLMKKNLLF